MARSRYLRDSSNDETPAASGKSAVSILGEAQAAQSRLVANSWSDAVSTLLYGPEGAGKRTIAKAAADSRSIAFHEISMTLPWSEVSKSLFGRTDAKGESLSGLLAGSGPALVYFSNLERADPVAQGALMGLFSSGRTYVPGIGEFRTGADIWLVAGMSVAGAPRLPPEDPLSRSVRRRYRIEVPTGDDLTTVAEGMLDEVVPGRQLARDALPLIRRCLEVDDHLRALRRWIESAALLDVDSGPLSRRALARAIAEDLQSAIGRLEYRGARVSIRELEEWLDQFPEDLSAVAIHLVGTIARTYFIDTENYYQSIGILANRIREIGERHGEGRRVVMCGWQHMGKSAPTVAHDIKIEARLEVVSEIDLRREPHEWPANPGSSIFVIPDDVVGSGRTLRSLVVPPSPVLPRLLERYPDGHVVIAVIAAYLPGVQDAMAYRNWPRDRVELVPARVLRPTDMCFSESSKILPDPSTRDRLAAFCERMAAERMRGLGFPLGYGGMGGLVVLPMDVPNNSLPLLWHETGDWHPLFRTSRI